MSKKIKNKNKTDMSKESSYIPQYLKEFLVVGIILGSLMSGYQILSDMKVHLSILLKDKEKIDNSLIDIRNSLVKVKTTLNNLDNQYEKNNIENNQEMKSVIAKLENLDKQYEKLSKMKKVLYEDVVPKVPNINKDDIIKKLSYKNEYNKTSLSLVNSESKFTLFPENLMTLGDFTANSVTCEANIPTYIFEATIPNIRMSAPHKGIP